MPGSPIGLLEKMAKENETKTKVLDGVQVVEITPVFTGEKEACIDKVLSDVRKLLMESIGNISFLSYPASIIIMPYDNGIRVGKSINFIVCDTEKYEIKAPKKSEE